MATKIDISANIESDNKTGIDGEKSLKSLRTYQLGVVYKDEYGRETPVFTNEDASFTIPKAFSNTKNSITAEVKNKAPSWADTYKFFIKETSNEYYNLCMDRWYDAEDENIWLSFPSAERNKIQEDTFIILKKQAASQESIIEEARYKIIDIESEAPDDIKTDYEMYGTANIQVHLGATPESSVIKFDFTGGSNPWDTTPFYDVVLTDKDSAAGSNSAGFVGYPLKDVVVKLANTANDNTGWLDVSNIYGGSIVSTGPTVYDELYIQLSKPLKGNAGDSTGSITDICPTGICAFVSVKLAKKVVKNKSEFNGRFFVKIRKDDLINKYIRSVGNPAPFFEIKQTMVHQALKVNTGSSDSAYWAGVTRQWFIDNNSRQQTGSYPNAGGGGPWYEDDGYGLEGSGSNNPPSTPGWNNTSYSGVRSGSALSSLRCTMELSFSHIDDENKNGFSMANALNSSDREFMEKMSTVGTMFRWKEDPYQHIYIVASGTKNSQTSSTNGHGVLNFGERNWHRKSKRNKTIRLYLKFKTTGYRLNDDQSSSGTIQYYDDEADKWPFYYKSGGESYTPGLDALGNSITMSTVVAIDDNDPWDPTRRGYDGSNYFMSGASTTTYASITQATGSSEATAFNNTIQIVDIGPGDAEPIFTDNPAIWETEPKEDKGLDIYYEASQAYPLSLKVKTSELFAPAGAKVSCVDTVNNKSISLPTSTILYSWAPTGHGGDTILLNKKIDQIGIIDHAQGIVTGTNPILGDVAGTIANINSTLSGIELKFTRQDGGYTTAKVNYVTGYNTSLPPSSYFVNGLSTSYSCPAVCADSVIIKLDRDLSNERVKLPYFNCYTFGNGVESDRIRDDFNAIKLDKGVKASTVLDEPYEEEQRTNGLIYSGIYNSTSGINNLNQFIAAEKITKDVNPSYGSIQKLKERDTNLVTFCEDKVLKIMANKDAIYNADLNPQLIASNKVLGNVTSFAGEFGISKNPESFAEESFRMYFTDKQRGKVLRLSGDGITPISDIGMKDYFADNLKLSNTLIGSFDDRKGEYNLTLKNLNVTVSFSESAKGWTSFKSFIQDDGLSLNNNYYTFKGADENNLLLWEHHSNQIRNNFYSNQYNSHVDVLFNEESATVKSFASMKYEGSQAKITQNLTDEEYYNNIGKPGWYVESGNTDLQLAGEMEFKDKEGKWFSYMKGVPVKGVKDLNSKEFSFQGIDKLQLQFPATGEDIYGCTDPLATNYNPNATIDDGSCVTDCSSIDIGALWLVDIANGFLELTPGISAGNLPHTYTVTDANGVIYPNTTGPNPNPGGVYTRWTGLPSGQYTFEILSNSGCQESESFQINLSTIPSVIYGCTDPLAVNYNPNATDDDGSCTYPNPCELVIASLSAIINTTPDTGTGNGGAQVVFDDPAGVLPQGYQPAYWWYTGTVANNVQDNTLVASSTGISTGGLVNNPPGQNFINGLAAGNYHLSIDTGDNCYRWFDFVISTSGPITGCMDPLATNYNPNATISCNNCCNCAFCPNPGVHPTPYYLGMYPVPETYQIHGLFVNNISTAGVTFNFPNMNVQTGGPGSISGSVPTNPWGCQVKVFKFRWKNRGANNTNNPTASWHEVVVQDSNNCNVADVSTYNLTYDIIPNPAGPHFISGNYYAWGYSIEYCNGTNDSGALSGYNNGVGPACSFPGWWQNANSQGSAAFLIP